MLWDLSRTDNMPLEKDVFPRLFPDRDLIMRSGNQGHQMRATDYGNASQWTLGIPPFHRSPECVFRNICISAQPPNRSNGSGQEVIQHEKLNRYREREFHLGRWDHQTEGRSKAAC